MPQDGLKSAVYRSFVKCDDPKGIAECTTMRKSKTSSQSSDSVSRTKTNSSNFNASPPENKGKGKKIDSIIIPKQESFSSSLLHLKEISEGAQNLNGVIDTYSNGMRFDRNSKQIAKDLLKGALDLQESLMVLGKLQEASNYIAKFGKKPKENTKSDRNEEKTWIKRSKSDRYTDYSHQTGFQKPRFSVDGSSRDCYDELRTVIRDSLARQNLLSPNFHKKTNISAGKMVDSMVDIPSTSSTQSSTMNFISFTSSDTSFSSDSTKRPMSSNLIAKLMGLEEIPSQQVLISSPKRFEIEKFPIQKRPKIDMAKEKKPQLGVEKDTEEKKLREIVETMRYKGLLKGNSCEVESNYSNCNSNKNVEEIETTRYKGKSNQVLRAQSNYSDSNNGKNLSIEDGPPIVLMKPMNVSRAEPEENDSQKLVRKSRMKDMNRCAVDFDEVCRRLRGEVTQMRKQAFKEKELSNKEFKEELSSKGVREFKEKVLSDKLKALASIDQKEKKKRLERVDKVNEPQKKLDEMQNFKSKTVSAAHDQAKVKSTKEKKTEKEPISRRGSVSPQKSNHPVVVSKNKPPLSQKDRDRKKNQKLDTELLADSLNEEDVELKHGETQINQSCCDKRSTGSSTTAQFLTKEETNADVDQIQEQSESTKSEIIAKSDEEASCLNSDNSATEDQCFKNLTNEQILFIRNPLFLKHAEELFDFKTNPQVIQLEPMISNAPEITDTRLLLDVASELMLQKKLSTQSLRPPFLTPPNSLNTFHSLTQLVDEVCKGINDFSKYSENSSEMLIAESLYSVLERDLLAVGLANGAWELGWRHGYIFDDVEEVVGDIENQVLDELIKGLFRGVPQLASQYM